MFSIFTRLYEKWMCLPSRPVSGLILQRSFLLYNLKRVTSFALSEYIDWVMVEHPKIIENKIENYVWTQILKVYQIRRPLCQKQD